MKIIPLTLGPMANNTYIIGQNGNALVIDPSWDISAIEAELDKNKLSLESILLTHGHFDHWQEIDKLLKNRNIPVMLEEGDKAMITAPIKTLKTFKGDSEFNCGDIKIKVIHTPGHSPGSVCYLIENCLFTGDTLFDNGCGRVDLPGSNAALMQKSLLVLTKLDGKIEVYPGHAYSKDKKLTIASQLKTNPYLHLAMDGEDTFISAMN